MAHFQMHLLSILPRSWYMSLVEEISRYWWEQDAKPRNVIAGEEIGEENVIEIHAWHVGNGSRMSANGG